jgi:hypothetical protein
MDKNPSRVAAFKGTSYRIGLWVVYILVVHVGIHARVVKESSGSGVKLE